MGLSKTTLGLELSDVLPSGTPPAAFLQAREKYFSFYPMMAVLKGPNIDFPTKQKQIEQYRKKIGKKIGCFFFEKMETSFYCEGCWPCLKAYNFPVF